MGRLETASGAYGAIGYSYDATGNRLSRSVDSGGGPVTESLTIDGASNLVTAVDGRTYGYDAAGRLASIADPSGPDWEFLYGPDGRLAEVKQDGNTVATYLYNALGQRGRSTAILPTSTTTPTAA